MFLDRDGVLDEESPEFIKSPDELHVFPYAAAAVSALNAAGFLVVVITNQSGIRRGLLTEGDLAAINAKLTAQIRAGGGKIAGIYHCPHMPEDGCQCRKPLPGMLLRAAREHSIDLSVSFLVGDRPEDIAAGGAAGCRTLLVLTGRTSSYDSARFPAKPDHVCDNLLQAAVWICGETRQPATDRE